MNICVTLIMVIWLGMFITGVNATDKITEKKGLFSCCKCKKTERVELKQIPNDEIEYPIEKKNQITPKNFSSYQENNILTTIVRKIISFGLSRGCSINYITAIVISYLSLPLSVPSILKSQPFGGWNTHLPTYHYVGVSTITALQLSVDHRFLFTMDSDNSIQVWSTETGMCLRSCPPAGIIYGHSFQLSQGDHFLLSLNFEGHVSVLESSWNPEKHQYTTTLTLLSTEIYFQWGNPVYKLAISNDGQFVVARTPCPIRKHNVIIAWRFHSSSSLVYERTFDSPPEVPYTSFLAVTSDQKWLIAAHCLPCRILVWNFQTGKLVNQKEGFDVIQNMYATYKEIICLTQDENWLLAVFDHSELTICKIPEMYPVYYINVSERIYSVTENRSQDAMKRVIALSLGTRIELWSCRSNFTELQMTRIIRPEHSFLRHCRLALDGRILIVTCEENYRHVVVIKFFDTTTGELIEDKTQNALQ